jgi:hypothetical protein
MNRPTRYLLLVLAAQLLARTLFLIWLPANAHSYDLDAWVAVASLLSKGENPYRATGYLSWPPFWMQHIFFLSRLSDRLHLSLITAVRLFLIVSETLMAALLFFLTSRRHSLSSVTKLLLFGIALNPIAVLLVCQHGNFDVVMSLWVVLFIGAILAFQQSRSTVDWLWACTALGIAVLYKTVPLILTPLLLYQFRTLSWKSKALGSILCLGPAALALSVLYTLEPKQTVEKIIRYRSLPGFFGVTGLLQLNNMQTASQVYPIIFFILSLGLGGVLGFTFWRTSFANTRVFALSALLLLLWVATFGPGYGPQYGYWYLPLMLISFLDFGRIWVRTLLGCYLIAVATYLEEYGLLRSHGMFLVRRGLNPSLLGINWSGADTQTLARLPLFLSFVWILCLGGHYLYRELVPKTVPQLDTK